MERNITGYHQDDEGDWVAELACGHNQHVRHRPPFQPRPWVLNQASRLARIGTPLDCPLCDRAEMPDIVRYVRRTALWDQDSMPAGLRRAHRLGSGTWGRIVLHDGRLAFSAQTTSPIDVVLDTGTTQAIPPEVEHHVEPLGDVRFHLELFMIDPPTPSVSAAPRTPLSDEGGDPACWAALVCPSCGNVIADGGHGPRCPESLDT